MVDSATSVRATVQLGQLSVADTALPLLVEPLDTRNWRAVIDDIQAAIKDHLEQCGGVLLRGFDFNGEEDFREFAQTFGHDLLSYDYASTPRTKVDSGVYTSTEYPAHQIIPLHNEQAYTLSWPMRIWFHCVTASPEGGETPIADSRKIFQMLDENMREKFAERELLYVRNYGNGLDLPWQKAFGTEDAQQVESFCRANSIEFEWKGDGELRTRQRCQAVAQHPRTGEMVWFNQAHLFHISNLPQQTRDTLISIVGEENLPRNVYYGDGTPIDEQDLDHVRSVLDQCQVVFPWQEGDVLMLDNMLAAHGRSAFSGNRKIVVAMAEPMVGGQLV
ncbi:MULTISPECIES: TauD/TfdA family dioxygenase [Marinomonas]|uniref:Alpha-ketoglutarate-dependent taurine dioxygenase n=1 Tax=Marinomonas alcarazii TaxID=491949 RepID=A0A318V9B3_9GAMM|nr:MULTISPECIES: TauD/TfdA family dioxygenase [Marinomonas]PYF84500.1 alpha-ketoglutarate-dependent taurine dioxygenase [Marinomonas alcarazii]